MTEEDTTVWKVIKGSILKHQGISEEADDYDEDDINVKYYMYHMSKFRKSLRKFKVTTEEFLWLLRERSDDLEEVTPEP